MTSRESVGVPDNPERERKLRAQLERHSQAHVLRFVDELDAEARRDLLEQVESLDLEELADLVAGRDAAAAAVPRGEVRPADVIPIARTDAEHAGVERARACGEQMLRDGAVAVMTVAGGQGTRLGFDSPKGKFPIGPVTDRTLFQLYAEGIAAAGADYGVVPLWMILTSPATHQDTVDFFESSAFFGLASDRVKFLMQGSMPAVDRDGKLLLESKSRIVMSPNGHGGSLLALRDEGGLDAMRAAGATTLYYFQVDNPLVPIPDPVLLGHHRLAESEMSTKVVAKRSPDEKVGVLCEVDGKTCVIEYSDLDEERMQARDENGQLLYRGGNIAVHALERSFIERIVDSDRSLPYHRASKKIPFIDERGQRVQPSSPNGTKFEAFVFDALVEARRTVTQEVARESEFAPVKNAEGDDSPETARRALTELYARWLREAGVAIPANEQGLVPGPIEISPLFARDANGVARRIAGREDWAYREGWLLTSEDA